MYLLPDFPLTFPLRLGGWMLQFDGKVFDLEKYAFNFCDLGKNRASKSYKIVYLKKKKKKKKVGAKSLGHYRNFCHGLPNYRLCNLISVLSRSAPPNIRDIAGRIAINV